MPLTCINCKLLFENPDTHRMHFKSEWHKYNLKRKSVDLPTVSFEEFQRRAATFNNPTAATPGTPLTCKPCHKSFSTENALSSHLKSKKHLEISGKQRSMSASDVVQNIKNKSFSEGKLQPSKEESQIESKCTVVECPPAVSEHSGDEGDDSDDDWESIDDEEDCESIDGDEDMPVVPTNICFFCSCHSKTTELNVQHLKIAHSFYIPDAEYLINLEGLLGYLGRKVCLGFTCLFCNVQKRSVKSVQQHMDDKSHCRMLFEGDAAMKEYEDFYDYSASYPDHLQNENDEASIDVLESDGYQLTLPSGSTIGHRSLALYYKQNLPPVRAAAKGTKLMHSYRALCQSGSFGKMPYYKTESYKYAVRRQQRYTLRLAVKQNKFQPHFRSQIMF